MSETVTLCLSEHGRLLPCTAAERTAGRRLQRTGASRISPSWPHPTYAGSAEILRSGVGRVGSRVIQGSGGLWIGAADAPFGAQTANTYLDALLSDANQVAAAHFEGEYGNISAVTGVPNPLLTTPNAVNAAGLAWSSLGEFGLSDAPASAPGIGALVTIATDAEGHRLITTNIPEPTGFIGLGAGGAALFAARRRTGKRRGD